MYVYRNYVILVVYCVEVLAQKLFEPYYAGPSPEWYQTYKPCVKLCSPVVVAGEVQDSTMALYSFLPLHFLSGQAVSNGEIIAELSLFSSHSVSAGVFRLPIHRPTLALS